jgi:hypothetical protein
MDIHINHVNVYQVNQVWAVGHADQIYNYTLPFLSLLLKTSSIGSIVWIALCQCTGCHRVST